jgi:hypothetical protein
MRLHRLLLPTFLVISLLFMQQIGAAHVLRHELADLKLSIQNKQLPGTHTCEKCHNYAQLASALSADTFIFTPPVFIGEAIQRFTSDFKSIHTLAAVARGPPVRLRKVA